MVFNVFLRVEKKCFVSRQPKLLNHIHSRHTLIDSETDTNHTHSHTKCACELLIIFYFLSTYSFRVIFISFQVVFDLHRKKETISTQKKNTNTNKRAFLHSHIHRNTHALSQTNIQVSSKKKIATNEKERREIQKCR